jgi:L-tyrosine isonitrile synthase
MDALILSSHIETTLHHASSSYIGTTTARPAVRQRPARPGPLAAPSPLKREGTPDEILRSFNTWAFKREQPDSIELLRASLAKAAAESKPVNFVLYWGKGLRCNLADEDIQCLEFLRTMGQRVREAYAPGAAFTLIFTDTHAGLNGHSEADAALYFSEVRQAAAARNFSSCILSQIVAAQGEMNIASDEPDAHLLEKLHACATRWYRGDGPAIAGAKKYYEMNMIEKSAVQMAFPDSIFVTFNGSEMRQMFPERLPIFYMYSLKRGTSVKPWFLPAAPAVQPAPETESVD